MTDYKALIEHSYATFCTIACDPANHRPSRLEWISDEIFGFTTYDSEMSEKLATHGLEVCEALNAGTTFDYVARDIASYAWYIVMCNMPFFSRRISWGTSIRGAWWEHDSKDLEFGIYALWEGDRQIEKNLSFTHNTWKSFITALIDFSAGSGDDNDDHQD